MHALTMFPPPRLRFPHVLMGGVAVGTFDLVFACTWWAIAAGVPPIRIFQSIGSGLLGEASFEGGLRSAALGGVAHYLIATCMVLAYALLATRLPALVRQPWRWGALYGLFLYGVMNFVVVPLSAAAGPSKFRLGWVLASIAVHAVIGIAAAFFSRRALRA